jgi:digeranylgeranylglycerophospholipid reductase
MGDAIVIGAGPAGTTAASTLAEKGYHATVFEKGPLKREKPCGGGIPEIALKHFSLNFQKGRPVYGILLCSPQNEVVNISQKERAGITVMREEFDYYLVKKAQKMGVTFKEYSPVSPLLEKGVLKGVKTQEGDVESEIIIICDGALSPSAKHMGLYRGSEKNQAMGFQYQMAMDNELIRERIGDRLELYFGNQWAPSGYSWIFPKDGIVTVGNAAWLHAVKKMKVDLKYMLDQFIAVHPVASRKLKGARVLYSQSHMLSFKGVVKTVYGDHFLIAGDAGGFISYATGGGLYYAMVSGAAAGETAAEALKRGDYTRKFLKTYKKKVNQKIGADMKWGPLVRRLFLTRDTDQERLIRAIQTNAWMKELTILLLKEEIRYDQFLMQVVLHPHEIIKTVLKNL